jgi:PmbA protein
MTEHSPSRDDLLALASRLVDEARARGATDAEVFAEHAQQTSIHIEQSDIKGASIDEHRAVGVRVLIGDREGFAYANRSDDEGLTEAIDDALAIARAANGDPANGFVEPAPVRAPEGLFDAELLTLAPDACVDHAAAMLARAKEIDARVSADGSFSVTVMRQAVCSSRGVTASGEEAIATYGLHGMAVDGDEVGSFDHIYEGRRRLNEIKPIALAERFARQVLSLLKPVEGTSYKGKVVFSADAFEEIFLDGILSAVDGDAVHKGRSRFQGKLGESVAAKGFTLVDDGTLAGAFGSGVHDREGLPHQKTVIIDDGVLKSFLYDGKSARRASARSTGHATGSARATPHIGTTNILVAAGRDDEASLLRSVGDGLFVGRFAGNVDGVSGDFSGVAKGSFRIEGGTRTRPVKETLIAGNVFDLLPRIVGIGSVQHENMATRAPWIMVDDVDVTAGAGD